MQQNDPKTREELEKLEDQGACIQEMLKRMRAEMESGDEGGLRVDDLPVEDLCVRIKEWFNYDSGKNKIFTECVTLSSIHKVRVRGRLHYVHPQAQTA